MIASEIGRLVIDRFVNSFENPPDEVTLDIDVFDNPTHGDQHLTRFHRYYRQYQYLVHAITCTDNGEVVLPSLLYGTADPALGAGDDLKHIAQALHKKYPDVLTRLFADWGHGKPWLYEIFDRLDVEYSTGIGRIEAKHRRITAKSSENARTTR